MTTAAKTRRRPRRYPEGIVVVNVPLERGLHTRAKARAALDQTTLQDWARAAIARQVEGTAAISA